MKSEEIQLYRNRLLELEGADEGDCSDANRIREILRMVDLFGAPKVELITDE